MMNEPRRLRDESQSQLECALLNAGSAYPSTKRAHAKTLAALGLAGSAVLSAGSASASIVGQFGWMKLLAVSAIGATSILPIAHFVSQQDAPREAPLAAQVPPPAAQPTQPHHEGSLLAEPTGAEPEPANQDQEPASRAPSADARSVLAPKAPTRASAPGALLGDELAALDAARAALTRGKPAAALSLLDTYGRAYPRGRLRLEAEVLRIDALSRSGQTTAARRRAQSFLERHPNSVLASRIRGYL